MQLARRKRRAHLHGRKNGNALELQGVLPDALALAAALTTSTVAPALATARTTVATHSAVPAAAACVAAAAAAARLQQQLRVGAYVFGHHHRDVSAGGLGWGFGWELWDAAEDEALASQKCVRQSGSAVAHA